MAFGQSTRRAIGFRVDANGVADLPRRLESKRSAVPAARRSPLGDDSVSMLMLMGCYNASVMSLYNECRNEADFRERFIKPLLNRLGFWGVVHEHGSQEFGKDFVFSELHRLGGLRHYAAQVKHDDSIKQGRAVDDLLSQVRQAFATPFRRGDSPRECHVSAVYVFNSGEITDNAKRQLLNELKVERYGDNVHFLDGDRLKSLNQSASYHDDRSIRARLSGLRSQMSLNHLILGRYEQTEMDKSKEGRGLIWSAIEQFMSEPIEPSSIATEDIYQFWQLGRLIESCATSLTVFGPSKTKEANLASIKNLAPRAKAHAFGIIRGVDLTLESLKPII
jgi:hypothetical protein